MGRPPRKKSAIERSALELFAATGIDGTSVRMIAERAGVTEGALYRHHAGKDELVRALFLGYAESYADLPGLFDTDGPPLDEQIAAATRLLFKGFDDDPEAFRYVWMKCHHILDPLREDTLPLEAMLRRRLEEAIRRGEIEEGSNPALLAAAVVGIIKGVARARIDGRMGQRPLIDHADSVAAMAVRLLGVKHRIGA